jgi:cell division protein FtsQ
LSRARTILRRTLWGLGLAALGAALALGARYAATVEVRAVTVAGAVHADPDELVRLAAIPDSARLMDLDPRLLADRVARDPWVYGVRVSRRPDGTVLLRVTEREPVALALDASGRPAHYFDLEGHMMPAVPSALRHGYDVPLLVGSLPRFLPTQPVEDPALRRLLTALAGANPVADALISAVERAPDGSLTLHTAASPSGVSLPVALGREGSAEQIARLQAFWEQAVLPGPDAPIRQIDLRFGGQIITR